MRNCYLDVCLHNSLIQRTNGVVICTVSTQIIQVSGFMWHYIQGNEFQNKGKTFAGKLTNAFYIHTYSESFQLLLMSQYEHLMQAAH